MSGTFDIGSAFMFLTAFFVTAYSVLRARDRIAALAAVCLLAAMALMTFVSVSNALEHLQITSYYDGFEDYAEVLFVPLLTYAMYGLYAQSHRERAIRDRAAVARLGGRLARSFEEMDEHRIGMLQALSAAVDTRDHYTAEHSLHVADYACAIAYRLGMKEDVPVIEQAGLLHDIGKIGISDTLLLKPGPLTDAEYAELKRHSSESANIIETVPFLSDVVPLVRHHHECWDGSGYPDGLSGELIPRASRVLAVADAFDAMTTDRPYRLALSIERAREILMEGRGVQWDPAAVDALLALVDDGLIVIRSAAEVA